MSVQREPGRVEVATTDREITAHAGAILLRQAAKAVGLARSIGEHLRLKKRARGLTEAQSTLAMGDRITLDFDSTYIRSYSSRREGADRTWTKRYTLHPLLCFVAGLGTCLHAALRRGKANTSRGILRFVDECLRLSSPDTILNRSVQVLELFVGALEETANDSRRTWG